MQRGKKKGKEAERRKATGKTHEAGGRNGARQGVGEPSTTKQVEAAEL